MKRFKLSFLLTATMAGLLLGPPAMAQTVTEQQAENLLETADNVASSSRDIEEISAAYEQALTAFDQLGDFESSLSILGALTSFNYAFCRDDQMLMWAENALNRLKANEPAARRENLGRYLSWIESLGQYYEEAGQIERAIALYEAGETYATEVPEYIGGFDLSEASDMVQAQLDLLPQGSPASVAALNRLIALHQRKGAVTEVDALLADARQMNINEPVSTVLAQRALTLSERHGYQAGELRALLFLGKRAISAEDYSQAAIYGDQALTLTSKIIGTDISYHEALFILARGKQGQGQHSQAIAHYETILELLKIEPAMYVEAGMEDVIPNLYELYKITNQLATAEELVQTYPGMGYPSILDVHRALNPEPQTADRPEDTSHRSSRRQALWGPSIGDYRNGCNEAGNIYFIPRRSEYIFPERAPERPSILHRAPGPSPAIIHPGD